MAGADDDFNDAADSTIPPARLNWRLTTGPGTEVREVRNANGDGDPDRELVQMTNTSGETRIV